MLKGRWCAGQVAGDPQQNKGVAFLAAGGVDIDGQNDLLSTLEHVRAQSVASLDAAAHREMELPTAAAVPSDVRAFVEAAYKRQAHTICKDSTARAALQVRPST